MAFIQAIPFIGKTIDGLINLVREIVPDKDKQDQLIGNIEMLRQQAYMVELQTKTVPWVDAVHKMGRQFLAVGNIVAVVYLAKEGVDIDMNLLALLGGPNIAYQLIKGKGK